MTGCRPTSTGPRLRSGSCAKARRYAGFFELERHDDGSVEISYFGLMPMGIGQGLGRALLTTAIDEAWSLKPVPSRVWLHTCTLDHPAALANYLARGFQVTHSERYTVDLRT
jgi:GNAT superfamily N-acetyltransferase